MRSLWRAVLVPVFCLLLGASLLGLGSVSARAADGPPKVPRGVAPLSGARTPVRPFSPPQRRWQSGHRGVDLAGAVGDPVLAPAEGRISFAGVIAGRPVLVIDHGSVRSTFEPVRSEVKVGDRVRPGQRVGTLLGGHDQCPAQACLHWGLKAGEDYLDPMLMVPAGGDDAVRLLPTAARAEIEKRTRERAAAAAVAASGAGDGGPAPPPGAKGLTRPAQGPTTSPFGMRQHPVLHVWKLHDGLDFGTGCGAPLRASADGVVTQAYFNGGYGNRLLIDHGSVHGHQIRSAYNHAIRYTVGVGQRVQAGQVIGLSGSTGYSTGCHLHFMLWVDGQLVNPATWL